MKYNPREPINIKMTDRGWIKIRWSVERRCFSQLLKCLLCLYLREKERDKETKKERETETETETQKKKEEQRQRDRDRDTDRQIWGRGVC